MTPLALKSRERERALIPDSAIGDPEVTWHLMLALADTKAPVRETWIDHRLLGVSQDEIAAREQVSRQAVSLRIVAGDQVVRRYLMPMREALA